MKYTPEEVEIKFKELKNASESFLKQRANTISKGYEISDLTEAQFAKIQREENFVRGVNDFMVEAESMVNIYKNKIGDLAYCLKRYEARVEFTKEDYYRKLDENQILHEYFMGAITKEEAERRIQDVEAGITK